MVKTVRIWPGLLLLGFLCIFGTSPATADDPLANVTLPRENKVLDGRLKYARKLTADKKWSEAIEFYDKILRDVGDNLIPVSAPLEEILGTSRSLQVRRQCHLDIAAFPANALKLYRNTIQGQTKEWLEKGIKNRDEESLLRIVREAFCCQLGDQALNSLGDLAFEKGDFHQALQWWQMITPPASKADKKSEPGRLLFPDPQVDIDQVRAKMIMAYQFAGDESQTRTEFAAFQKLHDQSSGHLAGEKGNYVKILQKWLDKGFPTFERDMNWPTFAGNAARNGANPKLPHQRLWADGPTWSVAYKEGDPEPFYSGTKALAEKARQLAYYPILTHNRVLITDGSSVQMFDLFTGKKQKGYTLPAKLNELPEKSTEDKTLTRFSLTAADGRIFAVLGDQRLGPIKQGKREKSTSYLVCLKFDGKEADGLKAAWTVQAKEEKAEAGIFTGGPLVYQERVFVLVSRGKGLQTTISLGCFDALNGTELWQEELSKFFESEEENSAAVVDQPTLTLAGNQIVYCSHRGVIMAVDAANGTQSWAVRYPSRGPITIEGTPSPRDLCPCIYADGNIYAAPMDSNRILCLDTETGQLLWERDRIQVVHLLGCQHGKLVFTTSTGLRAIDAATGSDKNGWSQPGTGRLPPFGRGLILGDWVLWPTQHPNLPQRLVHISDGNPHHKGLTFSPVQVRQIKPGNMAFANDCLVVAENKKLTGYIAPRHFLKKYQQDANGPKPTPQTIYKLAQAEANAGKVEKALKHFQQAEKAVNKDDWEGESFQWKCLLARHDLLLDAARVEQEANVKISYLQKATEKDFPADLRLKAQLKLAQFFEESKQPQKALFAFQEILDDPELHNASLWKWWDITYNVRELQPQLGSEMATHEVRNLIIDHGRKIYNPIEEKAKQLAKKAVGEKKIPCLEKLLKQFPHSELAYQAFPNLAKEYEKHQMLSAAINLLEWGDLYFANFPSKGESEGLKHQLSLKLSLARLYEKKGHWEEAQKIWNSLKQHSKSRDPSSQDKKTIGELIKEHLAKPAYAALAEKGPNHEMEPDLPLPLTRKWDTAGGGLLHFNSISSQYNNEFFFSVKAWTLSCHKEKTGETLWKKDLSFKPNRLFCLGGVIVATSPTGIVGLRWEDGKPLWCWTTLAGNPSKIPQVIFPRDPFSCSEFDTFSHFHIDPHASFAFCLNEWFYLNLYPPTGKITLGFHWLFHPALPPPPSGPLIHPLGKKEETYPQRYEILDFGFRKFCVIKDSQNVVLYHNGLIGDLPQIDPGFPYFFVELDHFSKIWSYKPRLPTTLTGELPKLFRHKDHLLILLPRNYGHDLERIDPKTGTNVWKPAARLCDQAYGKESIAFHRDVVYYASGNSLYARDLENGDLLWQKELQESVRGWRVKATKQALMVFPGGKEEPTLIPVPFGGRAITVPAFTKRAKYPFCLQAHDYKDGKMLQRMEFDGDVYGAGIQFFPDSIVVTAGQKAFGIRGTGKVESKR